MTGIKYKVHLDGYDQRKFLTCVEGTVGKNNNVKSARDKFFYADDDGLLGHRLDQHRQTSQNRAPVYRNGLSADA